MVGLPEDLRRQFSRLNAGSANDDDGAVDGVLELANVTHRYLHNCYCTQTTKSAPSHRFSSGQ